MPNNFFTEISIIIAIGSVVGLVMHILRQPLIIGHILTGVLVGPTVFGIINGDSEDMVAVFSKIGIALLLFIIGLGLNPKVIKGLGRVALIVGGVQVAVTVLIGGLLSRVLGYGAVPSLAVGVALAFSSTIIILKLLSDKKEHGRLHGKIAIGVLIVQDLIATLALLAATAITSEGLTFDQFANLAFKGIMLGGGLVIASLYVIPRLNKIISESQEFLFLFAIGWGLGIPSLFEINGFSIEIGALLAGMAIAPMAYSQEISARLRPLRDFFVVLFFINLGMLLNLHSLEGVWLPVILFSTVAILIKPLIILLILGFMGYTRNTSFKTAISMAQISEFSLVFLILLNEAGSIDDTLLTIMTLVAIISIAISTYLIIYSDNIYRAIEHHLTLFERRKVHYDQREASHYQLVLFGYNKGGNEFVKVFKSLKKKFVIVDYDPETIDRLEHRNLHYLYGDATDPELLDEIGVEKSKLIVSTITDHEINSFLASHIQAVNSTAVSILYAETPEEATELYDRGATYVMMPHYLGSERIGAFIKRNGLKRREFKKWREKHLRVLEEHALHTKELGKLATKVSP